MEILLWLVPSLVVTVVAMAWVGWVGRDGRGEVDRDAAIERLGKALAKEHRTDRVGLPQRPADRSGGIAVRPSTRESHTRRAS